MDEDECNGGRTDVPQLDGTVKSTGRNRAGVPGFIVAPTLVGFGP